jgi:hypothetical protein
MEAAGAGPWVGRLIPGELTGGQVEGGPGIGWRGGNLDAPVGERDAVIAQRDGTDANHGRDPKSEVNQSMFPHATPPVVSMCIEPLLQEFGGFDRDVGGDMY